MFSIANLIHDARKLSKASERTMIRNESLMNQIMKLSTISTAATSGTTPADHGMIGDSFVVDAAAKSSSIPVSLPINVSVSVAVPDSTKQTVATAKSSNKEKSGPSSARSGGSGKNGGKRTSNEKSKNDVDPNLLMTELLEKIVANEETTATVIPDITATITNPNTDIVADPVVFPTHTSSETAAVVSFQAPPQSHSNSTRINSGTSTIKPRSLILHAIQQESDKVRKLKHENVILKTYMSEYQVALEMIMMKYREQIIELVEQTSQCCQSIMSQHESGDRLLRQAENVRLTDRLYQMINMYETKIGPVTERALLEQRVEIAQLLLEHKTLSELYQISRKYAVPTVDRTSPQETTLTNAST